MPHGDRPKTSPCERLRGRRRWNGPCMATLKDAARVTDEIVNLATRLHEELTEGDVEFERMVELADDIGERADALAAAFTDVGRALAAQVGDGAGRTERDAG